MWSVRYGNNLGYTTEIKKSFLNQTTMENDFLNNEWEKILNEVEKQGNTENETSQKESQKKKELVATARKKYVRQLVKVSNAIGKQSIIPLPNKNQPHKKVAIASNMIEYYNGENIGVEGKDYKESDLIQPEDLEANGRSINDAIFSLLLLDKRSMHMNIVSDYEIKK